MTNKEKVTLAMKYLGVDHFYTEYDGDLSHYCLFKILPTHIIRDHMNYSFHLYGGGDPGRLTYSGYDGFSEKRNQLWVYIDDKTISEEIFKSLLPVYADRCLFKAKHNAKLKLMEQIISDEIVGVNLGFLLPDTKWDKLLKDE